MATFAKYVAPQVQRTDWGAITRGLSAGLQEVYKDREEQKAELDKLELDAAAKVNETEMGKSKTFNEFVLEGINTTKGYMASQNKLLKQGLITPAQYKMNILRAQEGWSTFAKNAETFNQDYADFLERYDGDEASAMEAFAREQYFSLTDIKNKQIYMNPADGNMYIANVDPKTYQIDTANLMDVKTINNALNQKITKLKLYDVAQEYVKKFGSFAGVDPVTGQYVVSGVNEKDRENVINRAASAILANDKSIASVLLDNMKGADGEPQFQAVSRAQYETLSDDEKKRSIIMEANAEGVFVPVLTEQNKKDARDFTESVIGDMIQRKEKDPEEARRWEEEMKLRRDAAYRRDKGGDDDSPYIIERARNLTGLVNDRTGFGNLVISGSHPTYGTLKDYKILGNGLVELSFINKDGVPMKAMQKSKKDATNIFNEILNVGAPGTTGKQRNIPIEDTNPYLSGIPSGLVVDLGFVDGVFMGKLEESARTSLNRALSPLGFTVEETGWGRDLIKITTPNGLTETFQFDEEDPSEADRLKGFVNKWVQDYNTPTDNVVGSRASTATSSRASGL